MTHYSPVEPPEWTWPDAYDFDNSNDDRIEESICWACGGTGNVPDNGTNMGECDECDGRGYFA